MPKQQITIEVDCKRLCTVCGSTNSSGYYLSRDERFPGRWCRGCFRRWERRGDPTSKVSASPGEPLAWVHDMLANASRDECWLWPYAKNKYGYGHMVYAGVHGYKVTHLVLELSGFPRPSGLYACHSCDTPACCNPSHLRWDTAAGNTADAVARGRSRGGVQRGEDSGTAKLTAERVFKIISLVSSGVSKKAVAREFGVVPTTVCNIVNGSTWTHLTKLPRQSKRRRPT